MDCLVVYNDAGTGKKKEKKILAFRKGKEMWVRKRRERESGREREGEKRPKSKITR